MTILLAIVATTFFVLFVIWAIRGERSQNQIAQQDLELANLRGAQEEAKLHYDSEIAQIRKDAEATIAKHHEEVRSSFAKAQSLLDQQVTATRKEAERIKEHYESEAKKIFQQATLDLAERDRRIEALSRFEALVREDEEVRQSLAEAVAEAMRLKAEAIELVGQARAAADAERKEASKQARETKQYAESILDRATSNAGRIVDEATKRAEQIGGDAYIALRDKQALELALNALWNNANGYGDRYVVPTRSVLDDLAEDFGHTQAGEALKGSREHSRRMVEQKLASACNYVEADRRDRANRFVVDAFNGRVDAILSRSKHDNYGTLEQEIRDAYALVNLNGIAFRDARILPAYLDARLEELKWAVVTQELRLKEREEQRVIKERIREEERARREYERAMQEAQREEALIKSAMEKARGEAERASAEDRLKFESQIATLNQQLAEAEARNQRAMSMAQQTKTGHVYIISNLGSFGEDVFKIGLTRRLEPLDRIKELGDASVPFDFDVHAMIRSEDAPLLESRLHHEFDEMRINKVNFRKEFFRVSLNRMRELIVSMGLDASFTMLAEAREFRETQAIERMTPEQRQRYYDRHGEEEIGTD